RRSTARQNSAIRSVPTGRPASRSERPKRVKTVRASLTDEPRQSLLGPAEVLTGLDRPAKRLPACHDGDRLDSEERQGAGPVDRLGDPRPLDEVELTQAGDRQGDRARETLGDVRHPEPDDLDLALEVREVDPVVETAALECVVELACPIRG